jgi:uncharacterized membrane protein YoaK (UPF0700 family)
MIAKLPRWIWAGTWVLAWIAGMVNVTGLMGFGHQAMTHLTGTTTMLSEALAEGAAGPAWHYAAAIGAFVAGCILSGLIVQDSTLHLGRRYGVALLLESALLWLAIPLMHRGHAAGIYCASCACGLQNAMVSTYSGAVVRTTHISGMLTDLGTFLGHRRRLKLCLTVISGFLCGGLAGALAFQWLSYTALAFPAGLTLAAAVGYAGYLLKRRRRRAAD